MKVLSIMCFIIGATICIGSIFSKKPFELFTIGLLFHNIGWSLYIAERMEKKD